MGFGSRSSRTAVLSASTQKAARSTPDHLRGRREAFGELPTQAAIIDGELCLIDPRGIAHFYRLVHQMRWPEEGLRLGSCRSFRGFMR